MFASRSTQTLGLLFFFVGVNLINQPILQSFFSSDPSLFAHQRSHVLGFAFTSHRINRSYHTVKRVKRSLALSKFGNLAFKLLLVIIPPRRAKVRSLVYKHQCITAHHHLLSAHGEDRGCTRSHSHNVNRHIPMVQKLLANIKCRHHITPIRVNAHRARLPLQRLKLALHIPLRYRIPNVRVNVYVIISCHIVFFVTTPYVACCKGEDTPLTKKIKRHPNTPHTPQKHPHTQKNTPTHKKTPTQTHTQTHKKNTPKTTPQTTPKTHQKHTKNTPKTPRSHSDTIPIPFRRNTDTILKPFQSLPNTTQKPPKHNPKTTQKPPKYRPQNLTSVFPP